MKNKSRFTFIKLLFITLCGALAMPASAVESKDPIKLTLHDWTGQYLTTTIMGRVLEELGYNVEYVQADYIAQFAGLESGDLHIAMEMWEPTGKQAMEASLATGNTVKNIWLGKGWEVRQQALIADKNGNGSQEVAVLRVKNTGDAVNVLFRDTRTRQGLGSIGFDRNYPPTHLLSIKDVNGNGADEVVVFGQRFNGANQKAQIKDSKSLKLIRLGPKDWHIR